MRNITIIIGLNSRLRPIQKNQEIQKTTHRTVMLLRYYAEYRSSEDDETTP